MGERETIMNDGQIISIGVAASTKIELGKLVCNNGSGYGVEGADTVSYVTIGVAEETVDNSSGSNGDLDVKVRRKKAFWFKNSSTAAVTIASIGASVYIEDDETVALASGPTNDIVAGTCLAVDSTLGVLVEIG
jgi:hypothetical protein